MAMRPRRRTGAVRPVYEDFRPVSEWQQDDESHILNIFLPGSKDQVRISTEDKNIIRVQEELLVAGNKLIRLQEDFQVPENSEISSVRAKHQGEVLSITVPKKKVDKPKEEIPSRTKTTEFESRNKGTSQRRDKKDLEEPQKMISSEPDEDQKSLETKKTSEEEEPNGLGKITSTRLEEKRSVLSDYETDDEASAASFGEERQSLLVNMGVAVFAIMGFGAYVTCKFITGKE